MGIQTHNLTLEGELTIFRAQELKRQIIDFILNSNKSASSQLDIDLNNVSEIDTAGIQLMLMAKYEAAAANRQLAFINHSQPVLDILELSGLAAELGDPLVLPATHLGRS